MIREDTTRETWLERLELAEKCVHHYTTIGALSGMLNEQLEGQSCFTFWASIYSSMNDPEERDYGVKLLKNILEEVEESITELPKGMRITNLNESELDDFIATESLKDHNLINEYSVSFSKAFDSLPMWAMYAQNGNGISLGFDHKEVDKYLLSKDKQSLAPIAYGIGDFEVKLENETKKLDRFKEYVKQIYQQNLPTILKNFQNHPERNKIVPLFTYVSLLRLVAHNLKSRTYSYEKEYRMFSGEEFSEVLYRDRNGFLVPYIKLHIPASTLKMVVLGPTMDKNRQILHVAKLLKSKIGNIDDLQFYGSEIKYKP